MIAAAFAFLKGHKALALAIGAGLLIAAVLFVVHHIYSKGEAAGASGVTKEVQKETIKQLEEGRKDKEKADEKTRDTPYDDRIDRLR